MAKILATLGVAWSQKRLPDVEKLSILPRLVVDAVPKRGGVAKILATLCPQRFWPHMVWDKTVLLSSWGQTGRSMNHFLGGHQQWHLAHGVVLGRADLDLRPDDH